jgi:4'-phosphopantetheinyl transferase
MPARCDVVICLEQCDANVPPENDWLSAAECERLQTLWFAKRQNEWRLGRWTAKRAVAAWLGLPASPLVFAQIEVVAAPNGAPEVFVAYQTAPLRISLSHRAGTALCAVAPAGAALGCDVEIVEPRSDAFVADYFTVKEQAYVAEAGPEARDRVAATLWSAKESALKALQFGLTVDTRDVTVNLPAGAPGRAGWSPLEVHTREGRIFQGWWQESGGFVRTVVDEDMPEPPHVLHLGVTTAAAPAT